MPNALAIFLLPRPLACSNRTAAATEEFMFEGRPTFRVPTDGDWVVGFET